MNVFLYHSRCTCLFIVLANVVVMSTSSDRASGNEYPVNYFSGEFENFLHGLGSMVYKYKNPARQTPDSQYFMHEYQDTTSTEATKIYRRNNNLLSTQKEVLKDVLMMKLVSYYEDKYKVTDTENQDNMVTTKTPSLSILTKNMQSPTAYNQRPKSETYSYNVKTSPKTNRLLKTAQRISNDIVEVEVL